MSEEDFFEKMDKLYSPTEVDLESLTHAYKEAVELGKLVNEIGMSDVKGFVIQILTDPRVDLLSVYMKDRTISAGYIEEIWDHLGEITDTLYDFVGELTKAMMINTVVNVICNPYVYSGLFHSPGEIIPVDLLEDIYQREHSEACGKLRRKLHRIIQRMFPGSKITISDDKSTASIKFQEVTNVNHQQLNQMRALGFYIDNFDQHDTDGIYLLFSRKHRDQDGDYYDKWIAG